MSSAVARRPAFTLVELIIVVAVIGILAAIVLPRFSSAANRARSSGMLTTLQALRSQIELYRLNHNDQLPTLAELQAGDGDWAILLNKTDANGTLDPDGEFGPYLRELPINPFTNSSMIVAVGAATTASGWTYVPATGIIKAVLPANVNPADHELDVNDYEQL